MYADREDPVNKGKITVWKETLDEELAKEYGVSGLGACPMLKEGQVFHADYAKPEGFCDGDWIRKPGVAICSCTDGLRPVIFKLEATQEPSKMDYTPVR